MGIAFDDVTIDLTVFEVRRGDQVVPLEPQAFDVLAHLIAHADRVVSKEELMDTVWGGRFVSESAVTSRIKQIRRAVGDDGGSQRVIRTVHGRGYRFIANLIGDDEKPDVPGLVGREAPVRYTTSDGLSIAYQVTGLPPGPGVRDIVLVAGFISHLEQDWGDPHHDRFLDRLGSMGRLVRFDKRGTGMSDRPHGLPDVETRMHDVLAVMDELDLDRAVVFGYSEGGPMATMFAAAHPERVSALVLYGAYPVRRPALDYPWAQSVEERAAYIEHLATSWDWEGDFRMRAPSASPETARWWSRRMRAAATPTTVRALMTMNDRVDVRDALPAVRVPTLVVHRVGDQMNRVEGGRLMAARIPGARMVELSGADHFVSTDPDQILDPIEAFLAETPEPAAPRLALAAIVAVLTTGPLPALGEEVVRRTPDGVPVLLFDGPATAIRATARLLRREPGLRLGLQIAEVARDDEVISGFGVATAVALASVAEPGTTAVSATTRDLLAGSGVTLVEAGVRDLGPAGRQPVFRPADSE